jgi:hypothetical protein
MLGLSRLRAPWKLFGCLTVGCSWLVSVRLLCGGRTETPGCREPALVNDAALLGHKVTRRISGFRLARGTPQTAWAGRLSARPSRGLPLAVRSTAEISIFVCRVERAPCRKSLTFVFQKADPLVDVGVHRMVGPEQVARIEQRLASVFHVVRADGVGKNRQQVLNAQA